MKIDKWTLLAIAAAGAAAWLYFKQKQAQPSTTNTAYRSVKPNYETGEGINGF